MTGRTSIPPLLSVLIVLLFCCFTQQAVSSLKSSLEHVQFSQGRFDKSQWPELVQFAWSAVTFHIDLNSTSCSARQESIVANIVLSDKGNGYNVELLQIVDPATETLELVDSQVLQTGAVAKKDRYRVKLTTSKKAIGNFYRIRVSKRTEGMFGAIQLHDFFAESNGNCITFAKRSDSKRATSASPPMKIEWIGDSLTCAFGIEGESPCTFSASNQNALKSFAVKTSLNLDPNAQYNLICYSGKGVVRNYDSKYQTSPDPMPTYYNRTLTTRANMIWNFTQFIPDLVVITLGGNDFSTQPVPSFELFSAGYNALFDYVQHVYGHGKQRIVPIIAVCGPLRPDCYQNYSQRIVEQRGDKYVSFVSLAGVLDGQDPGPDYGCSGHPSVQGNEKMSVRLTEAIKQILKDMGVSKHH